MRLLISFFLFLFFTNFNCQAQLKWNSSKSKFSIPFENTHNLIIIDVLVNKVNLKMILDSGSESNMLFSFPENDTIELFSPKKIAIRGLGYGEVLEAVSSENNKISIKDNSILDDNFKLLIITNQDIGLINKLGVPINGILGADFFKSFIIKIDYQRKKITFYRDNDNTTARKFKSFNKKQIEIFENKPYLNANINNKVNNRPLKFLVDTGLSDGLWIFENDSIKCSNIFFRDFIGRGLGGDITGKKSRVSNLAINDISLENALVSYPDSLSISKLDLKNGRNGSIGGEVLKRFNWIFDYKNKTFYLKPNKLFSNPFHYNLAGFEVQHDGVTLIQEKIFKDKNENSGDKTFFFSENENEIKFRYSFKPSFVILSIRENSPAYKVGLEVGDKIISVNNKKAYNLDMQYFTNLLHSNPGNTIKIEVERKNKRFKYQLTLENVL